MKEELQAIEQEALAAIEKAENSQAVQEMKVKYLGKKVL